ncbi:class I tRNA ligase family protein [Escherichia coli]
MLQAWTRSGALQEQVANKMQEWFESGLQQWDISRDAPYLVLKLPTRRANISYVWLSTPIWLHRFFQESVPTSAHNVSSDEYWKKDSTAELYHFIGKDMFTSTACSRLPMLEGSKLASQPTVCSWLCDGERREDVQVSRHLSKASTWLDHFDADSLRYYYAAKLSSRIDDINLDTWRISFSMCECRYREQSG